MIIRTPSLRFRMVAADDAPWIYRLVTDPLWVKFIGDRGVHSETDAIEYVRRCQKQFEVWGFGLMTVTDNNNTPLGMCGLIDRGWFDGPDVGFAFLPESRGRGVARQAVAATAEWAFSTLNKPFLTAMTHPENTASQRVVTACGFRREGLLHTAQSPGMQVFYRLDSDWCS